MVQVQVEYAHRATEEEEEEGHRSGERKIVIWP